MKKLLMLVVTLMLGAGLAFAQTSSSGSTASTPKTTQSTKAAKKSSKKSSSKKSNKKPASTEYSSVQVNSLGSVLLESGLIGPLSLFSRYIRSEKPRHISIPTIARSAFNPGMHLIPDNLMPCRAVGCAILPGALRILCPLA